LRPDTHDHGVVRRAEQAADDLDVAFAKPADAISGGRVAPQLS